MVQNWLTLSDLQIFLAPPPRRFTAVESDIKIFFLWRGRSRPPHNPNFSPSPPLARRRRRAGEGRGQGVG